MSRVLIVDPRERVLLLHFRLWAGGEVWIPPGGGVDEGESAAQAAVREVWEETAVVLVEPLRLVWVRKTRYFGRDVAESYFLTRVAVTPAVVIEAVSGGAADLLEHRWWTVAEIAEAESEIEFTPRGLGEGLAALLSSGVPAAPIAIDA